MSEWLEKTRVEYRYTNERIREIFKNKNIHRHVHGLLEAIIGKSLVGTSLTEVIDKELFFFCKDNGYNYEGCYTGEDLINDWIEFRFEEGSVYVFFTIVT